MIGSGRQSYVLRTFRVLLSFIMVLTLLCAYPCAGQEAAGKLVFSAIVIDELVPKGVPLTDFRVTSKAAPEQEVVFRTDEQGSASIDLPPGEYEVSTVKPVRFKGRALSWSKSFKIESGQECVLKLTDSDASQSASGHVSEEGLVYQNVKAGVVTVEADLGSGSGFVVDKTGVVLTNAHVTNGTRWVALRFGDGIRVPALLVEEDAVSDVAVVRFNPDAYKDFVVIELAELDRGPVAVEGEKVLAIGSPLNQEKIVTTGIVSKVEQDVLMSDVNINPGNSGGPLLNLDGRVIGIATFGISTDSGPGVSGIVSIARAVSVLQRGLEKCKSMPPPSAKLLPDISPVHLSAESIQDAKLTKRKVYKLDGVRNIESYITTPFIEASIGAEADRELIKGRATRTKERGEKGVKEDHRMSQQTFYSPTEPVVTIWLNPKLKETGKSQTGGVLAGILGGLSGSYVHHKREFKFGDDFYDMQLYRGDTLVEPVRRNRVPAEILQNDYMVKVVDSAFGGVYKYDPSVFEPGQKLTLRVRRESNLDKWDTVKIDSKTQQKIWDEFAEWREMVKNQKQ